MQKELFEKAKSLREEQETVESFIDLLKSSRGKGINERNSFRDICVIDTADDIVCVSDMNETLYNVLMIALEAEHKRLEESFEKL